MKITLVRHGQTVANVQGLLDTGAPGPSLTSLGRIQAAAVPSALETGDIDGVAVSPLVRTSQTAAPLSKYLQLAPVVYDGLREIDGGALEMSTRPEAHQAYLETAFAWARGDLDRRIPGGPDGATFFMRFDEAIRSIADSGMGHVVAFSHGAAIRAWTSSRVIGVSVEMMERQELHNTGAVHIEGDPKRGWELLHWTQNAIGGTHLVPNTAQDPTGSALDEFSSIRND